MDIPLMLVVQSIHHAAPAFDCAPRPLTLNEEVMLLAGGQEALNFAQDYAFESYVDGVDEGIELAGGL